MSIDAYRALHVTGLILLMLGFGGSLLAPADGKQRGAMILHGIGALTLLVAGFGAMAKLGLSSPRDWPLWLVAKMLVWIGLAVLPLLVRTRKIPRALGLLLVVVLGAAAAWLGTTKATLG